MKRIISFLLCIGVVSTASAVPLINTDFSSYTGDLAGQSSWAAMPNTGTQAFYVSGGTADTAPYAGSFDTTDGNYLYISPSNTVGNLVDDEWAGSMDFKLSTTALAGTNIAVFGSAHDFFDLGLTAAATNKLTGSDENDLSIHLRHKNNGQMQVTLSKNGNYQTLGELSEADLGWDPTLSDTNNIIPDFETDAIRLIWNLRKTRIDNVYTAQAVLSNTLTGAFSVYDDEINVNFVTKTNLYEAAALTLAMGHASDADDDGSFSLVNIAIDSLSVDQTSGNAPILETPVLTATASDSQVALSWPQVFEATSYTVERSSTPGGPYSTVIGTTPKITLTDSTVVNDSLYYYIVTATAAGAADTVSDEATGEPMGVKAGSIFDTHFKAVDGYSNIDLAGQTSWKAQENSGANAFTVTDSAGEGYAANTVATFDTDLGNGVYYNALMSNNVADEWSGTINFTLSTEPTAGQWVTNGVDSYEITGMTFNQVFQLGLVQPGNKDNPIRVDDGFDDVGINLRTSASDGNIGFRLNNGVDMLTLDKLEIGWDPDWTDTANLAGPDFVTDEIQLDWRIKKSTAGTYLAVVDATVGGTTYNGEWLPTTLPSEMYASDLAMFGMTHSMDADKGKDLNDEALVISPVLVSINSMTVVANNNVAPLSLDAPIVSAVTGNEKVELSWEGVWDAESYTVYRHDALTGGTTTQLASGLTGTSYSDTSLENETTYWYSVAASFGSYGSVESSPRLEATPSPIITVFQWGPGQVVIANESFSVDSSTIGTVITDVGDGADKGLLPAYSDRPALHGVLQRDGGDWAGTQIKDNGDADYLKTRTKNGGVGSILIYAIDSDFPAGALDVSAQVTSFEMTMDVNSAADNFATGGALCAAIRNGTQWYVSQTKLGAGDAGSTMTISNLNAELWSPVTEAEAGATALMTVIGSAPATVSELTNITAIGYFGDNFTSLYVASMKVRSEDAGPVGTLVEQWAAGYGLSGDATAAGADPDLDGLTNLEEWGFAGNPNSLADTGTMPKIEDASGTAVLYLYPSKLNDPKPGYTVLESSDLTGGIWDDQSGTYTVTSGAEVDGTSGEYIWVTNAIPTDLDAKFIGLQITE